MRDYVPKSVAKELWCSRLVCPQMNLGKRMSLIGTWMDTIEEGRFADTNKMFEQMMVVLLLMLEYPLIYGGLMKQLIMGKTLIVDIKDLNLSSPPKR